MNRQKALLKNTGILAIGQLSSKVFTFFLLPLYTAVLLPDDYGTIDVLQTIISLALYFLTLQIESALFRFIIENRENEEEKAKYISSGILLVFVNAIVITLIVLAVDIFVDIPHMCLFILALWAQGFSLMMTNTARGLGHNLLYSAASFLITIVSLVVNIILILGFHIGAKSILIAIITSNIAGGMLICIKEKIWKDISFRYFNRKVVKEMLRYSLPLIPNAISWWVANASDRILINLFLTSTFNGIYAAANKIPTIYTTIFSVYNLAWAESIALSIHDKDRDQYIQDMMNSSFKFFLLLDLGIMCCVSLFFNVLIGKNYESSYYHIYILLVAIFVNSMCSLYGGIFAGFKDSDIIGITTISGAVVNFVFNLLTIRIIGLYAASISTLLSYVVIYLIRKRALKKYMKITIDKKSILYGGIALAIVTFGYVKRNMILNLCILVMLVVVGYLDNKEFILNMIRKKVNKK